jgi:deoxyribodipyrimidine photo-lyase
MTSPIYIHWFRQDLRLIDNPSLAHAATLGKILPIYIFDAQDPMGEASRLWLHHSLQSLKNDLHALSFYQGDPLSILKALIEQYTIQGVFWNRCYEPWQINRDHAIKQALRAMGVTVESFQGQLLWEPWTIKKQDGTPFKVFTPYYRKTLEHLVRPPQPCPNLQTFLDKNSSTLQSLNLTPKKPWAKTIIEGWIIGEQGANQAWNTFQDHGLQHYKQGRDLPSKRYVSRLSPHLHFGEISLNVLWQDLNPNEAMHEHFIRELTWREFSYHLLFFNPQIPEKNLQPKFDAFPWHQNCANLAAWQQGQTGIPLVDAGMRELWQTGYMHNRVRMITASFLVKNLLIHWHEGVQWFWQCLFDADMASNSASWQWVAGSGTDAAPYFRVFNPVAQGKKFDAEGAYVRCFVPELRHLPDCYLHEPWLAPKEVLEAASVRLGETYPYPIVDLKASREEALAAFKTLKKT